MISILIYLLSIFSMAIANFDGATLFFLIATILAMISKSPLGEF